MNRHFHSAPGRERAHRQVEYAIVKATLANRTDHALLLTNENVAAPVWVPRHNLDSRGKVAADRAPLKSEITVGVELNTALEKGLV
jgi:hypothetical protein